MNIGAGIISSLLSFIMLLPLGCDLKEEIDPNNPSLEGVLQNAGLPELNNLVTGTEAGMRDELAFYVDNYGVVGREMYRFSGADPRYTQDLLGAAGAVLDNNAFYTTRPWNAFYRTVKNCNILIQAASNTNKPSDEQKQGYTGFANTIKAYHLLLSLNQTYSNGIRIEVNDPDNLGPFVPPTEALTAIAALLETGYNQLLNAGGTFPFQLSSGFSGFNTPQGFAKFNRALAARVALYQSNYAEVLLLLDNSFLLLNGDLNVGVYHVFSAASGDQLNPVFLPPNSTGESRVAHPSFLNDAVAAGEGNDKRLNKILKRTSPTTQSNLTGTHDVYLYKTNTDPIPLIRNEELVLIYAEAKIRTGVFGDAVTALNRIRTVNDLTPYAGPVTEVALTNEMLKQRRYSLYMEGHRWVDMRRYNRLNELPIDRQGDDVWESFPIPFPENAP
jgi:hypothetical protein